MKSVFYLKLAWMGIWKNRRLYVPYILASMGMVMMCYIVSFLSTSSVLKLIQGGNVMQGMLGLGMSVIIVFSLLFLFYTNSFLTRRRKKEFGLYNILGMGKWNLAKILVWESLTSAVISMGGGLLAGIVFSKFAELGMVNLLVGEITFSFQIGIKPILETLKWFSIIFLLILLHTLREIRGASPVELLRSENAGEKPPKANWILALVGFIILGAAYFLAVSIRHPVDALVWFFVAVIMVIIATYLLFIAGSVTLCRILQKNKNYYYKTNHFVSVSSMVYRMKRNGAGLASICILCTMVLVMLSGTVCLYIGTEDSLRTRYPRNIILDAGFDSMDVMESGVIDRIRNLAGESLEQAGGGTLDAKNILDYRLAEFSGTVADGRILASDDGSYPFQGNSYGDVWQIFLIPLEDYNRVMGQNETLGPDEVLLYTKKADYTEETIALNDGEAKKIKKILPDFADNGVDAEQIIPSMYIFVPDLKAASGPLEGLVNEWASPILGLHWNYGFDLDCEEEMQIRVLAQIETALSSMQSQEESSGEAADPEGGEDGSGEALNPEREAGGTGETPDPEGEADGSGEAAEEVQPYSVYCKGVARDRAGFYGVYGGLFFLGILLGVVFVFAAVLIIYYKQISEGYEDQARFEIMQKVGMTEKDIKRSINSQILTVFFMPLILAGIHLAFAFPLIQKLLILFGLTNLKLLLIVTAGCFLIFALFYMVVYRITSRGYYHIVSGGDRFTA